MKKNIYLCNQNNNTMTTVDISTKFLGIDIPSPIISGSCGLTSKIENLVEMEKNGVGAVILKSLFEEQITFDIQKNTGFLSNFDYSESYDYISNHVEGFEIDSLNVHAVQFNPEGAAGSEDGKIIFDEWINIAQKDIDRLNEVKNER